MYTEGDFIYSLNYLSTLNVSVFTLNFHRGDVVSSDFLVELIFFIFQMKLVNF